MFETGMLPSCCIVEYRLIWFKNIIKFPQIFFRKNFKKQNVFHERFKVEIVLGSIYNLHNFHIMNNVKVIDDNLYEKASKLLCWIII